MGWLPLTARRCCPKRLIPSSLPETADSIKQVYKALTVEYKGVKKQMTQIQLEKYYNLKAKYQKTVAVWKTKRGAKAVGGWVKGVVGKKKTSPRAGRNL